jgi:hypothetical protein
MNWTRKEKVASTILGSIATIYLMFSVFGPSSNITYFLFFYMGVASNAFALTFSPHILFEKVSMQGFKIRGPIMYGTSALLGITGNICLIYGAFLWLSK